VKRRWEYVKLLLFLEKTVGNGGCWGVAGTVLTKRHWWGRAQVVVAVL
jgi:hypothetical protein